MYTIRFHDDSLTAVALELPPSVMLDIIPSALSADATARLDTLVPNRDKSVSVSFFADDTARSVEITTTGPSARQALETGAQVANAVVDDLRVRQTERWNSVTQYHSDRVVEIEQALAGTTADTDRAFYLVERAGHLDALGALGKLVTGNAIEDPALDGSPADSSGPGSAVALAGAFLGLAFGLLFVYIRLLGDRSVRRASELEQASGVGTVAVVSGANDSPVAAAAYTALAAAILKRYAEGSTLLVTSPSDSDASHRVAGGVAAALASLGKAGTICVEAGAPLGSGADAVHRAIAATATLLVARSGLTRDDDIRAAARILETAGAPVLGAVLCDVPLRELAWAADAAGMSPASR